MTPDEMKAATRRVYEELFSQGTLEVADELLAEDMVEHNAPPGIPQGREGAKLWISMFRSAFPDLKVTLDEVLVEGELVAARATWRGTTTGELMGMPPTGRAVEFTSTDVVRIRGSVCVEHMGNWDELGLLRQLGLVPEQELAPAQA